MITHPVGKRVFWTTIIVVLGILMVGCSDTPSFCLPANKLRDLKTDAISWPNWRHDIDNDIDVRMLVGRNQAGDLTPRAVFFDFAKKRVAILALEKFQVSPVYMAWVDDEIKQTLSDGQSYTTIHMLGYVQPELYSGRHLDSAFFLFQTQASRDKEPISSAGFYRRSFFQEGVLWFPVIDSDFRKHGYLGMVTVDSKESLATNSVNHFPEIAAEWMGNYDPAIDLSGRPLKLSQLDWVNIDENTVCLNLN